jgi:hypothetical protein
MSSASCLTSAIVRSRDVLVFERIAANFARPSTSYNSAISVDELITASVPARACSRSTWGEPLHSSPAM